MNKIRLLHVEWNKEDNFTLQVLNIKLRKEEKNLLKINISKGLFYIEIFFISVSMSASIELTEKEKK